MGIFSRLRKLENQNYQLRYDFASHLYMDKIVSCGDIKFKVKDIQIDKDDNILLCGGRISEIPNGWRISIDYPIKVKSRDCKVVEEEKEVNNINRAFDDLSPNERLTIVDDLLKSSKVTQDYILEKTVQKQKADEVVKGFSKAYSDRIIKEHWLSRMAESKDGIRGGDLEAFEKYCERKEMNKKLQNRKAKRIINDLLDTFDSLLKASNNQNDINNFECVQAAKEFLDSE